MSGSPQSPRNGLAKLLWEADPDDTAQDIVSEKERFHCPECDWTAELRRNECMVCDYEQPLQSNGDRDA
jgi:hypothetical protein